MGFCTKTDPEIRGILGRRAFPNPRQGCALRGGTFSRVRESTQREHLRGWPPGGDGPKGGPSPQSATPLRIPRLRGSQIGACGDTLPARSGYGRGGPYFRCRCRRRSLGRRAGSAFGAPGCVGVLAGRLPGAFPGRGGRFGKKRKQTGGFRSALVCYSVPGAITADRRPVLRRSRLRRDARPQRSGPRRSCRRDVRRRRRTARRRSCRQSCRRGGSWAGGPKAVRPRRSRRASRRGWVCRPQRSRRRDRPAVRPDLAWGRGRKIKKGR